MEGACGTTRGGEGGDDLFEGILHGACERGSGIDGGETGSVETEQAVICDHILLIRLHIAFGGGGEGEEVGGVGGSGEFCEGGGYGAGGGVRGEFCSVCNLCEL